MFISPFEVWSFVLSEQPLQIGKRQRPEEGSMAGFHFQANQTMNRLHTISIVLWMSFIELGQGA
jgi:hypothetical protein